MPLYQLRSKSVSLEAIRTDLIKLISEQISFASEQSELLLWINESNTYVSCHIYNSAEEETDNSDNYSVVEFEQFQYDEEEDVLFYELILDAIRSFPRDSFQDVSHGTFHIYESSECNEIYKIIELENGSLEIIARELEEGDYFADDLESDELHADNQHRKKTLLIWSFRTLLALILYYSFWDYKLVRWSLIIFIPLNLFSVFPFFLFWETVKEKWSDLKS